MTVILIACAAFAATLLGGSFAIRFRDRLHLILGFSAGAVVGVALFDLLPEAIALGGKYYDSARLALFVACGFFGYLVLDRLVLIHPHGDDGHDHDHDAAQTRGAVGAITLSVHSFLDGAAIGIGFQASPTVGLIVAVAVVAHDFSDGINTVGFILKGGGGWRRALQWLFVDACAPIAGAASTLLFRIPNSTVGAVLAVFAGCFLYLGATDLIPESQHRHPRTATTIMTLLGAATLYVAVKLWG
jgi:ZIP family zinc transporter